MSELTIKALADAIGIPHATARAYAIRKEAGTLKIINGTNTRVFSQEEFDELLINYLTKPPQRGPMPKKEPK